MPTLFITVVDISGSMGNSSVDTSTQGTSEAAAFSRADLVRHAVATQIELLRSEDEMALILFDHNAVVALPRTQMTPTGRTLAKGFLHQIRPTGGTAIWAGLQKALAIAETVTDKNVVIILQTDGESDPSHNPPRGIPATFRAWLDSHPATKLTLHTVGYGFGTALDMTLLRGLAAIGSGTSNYIPDGSMVGTVFIHLLANLMSCQYRGVKVHVPLQGQCIPVGFLQAGQTRDLILTLPDPVVEIMVTADNTADHATFTLTPTTPTTTEAEVAWPLIRDRLVTDLHAALTNAEAGGLSDLGPLIADCRTHASDPSIQALLSDLADPDPSKGQLGKAFATTDAFRRWGRHYVPGVLCGHMNQWPINFKDACSEIYGSAEMRHLIDRGEEIFINLPPPKASCAPAPTYGGGGGGGGVPVSYSLSSFSQASYGGCFLPSSRVRMIDGTEKRCDEIRPGDVTEQGDRIACVVKTEVNGPQKIVSLGSRQGGFTPWHPVLSRNGWEFPANIGAVVVVETDAVYNFVLAFSEHKNVRPGILTVDGVNACTLCHEMTGPVIGHPYFGRREPGQRNILDDLTTQPGWTNGYVVLKGVAYARNETTGFICGLTAK